MRTRTQEERVNTMNKEAIEAIEEKVRSLGYMVNKSFGTVDILFGDSLAVLWCTEDGEDVFICADGVYTASYGERIDTILVKVQAGWQEIQKFIKEIRR
jgi:hypothetical protein